MRASIEVADIFHAAGPAYRASHAGHLSLAQFKVMIVIEMFERWKQPRGPPDATATNRETAP
nr:hypothetical protein [Brucella intermedia]